MKALHSAICRQKNFRREYFLAADRGDYPCTLYKINTGSSLPILMMAYRSAVHKTTSFTPCELMFGRQIDLPIDLQLGRPEQDSGDQNKTEYVQRLQARLDRVHAFARGNMRLGSERH